MIQIHGPWYGTTVDPILGCCGLRFDEVETPAVVVADASLVTCARGEGWGVFTERFESVSFAGISYMDPITGEVRHRKLRLQ